MNMRQNNEAVSQMISAIMLLAIAILAVSIIYTQVLAVPGPQDIANVTIIGKIEDGHPVFDIQRGESLEKDTKIYINIAGEYNKSIYSLNDINNLRWDIGERIVLPSENLPSYKGPQVEGTIVDAKTNAIVFWGILQEGIITNHKGGIWHFDEPFWNGTLNEVRDSSGNNNHGIARDKAKISTDIKVNGNAGNFTGFINDDVLVETAWALNITNEITVEAWMKPQNPRSIVENRELPLKFGFTPYILHFTGDMYVVISEDTHGGKCGNIQTVKITKDGDLNEITNITFGDSTANKNFRPMLTQISEKMFLASFIDWNLKIQLRTFNISEDGTYINYTGYNAILNESSNNLPNRPSVQKIADSIYAIAYWVKNGSGVGPGVVKTVTISSTGEITSTGHMMQYDSNEGNEPCLIHIAGDTYAIAYRDDLQHGIVKTFNISSDGSFGVVIDTKIFENGSANEPCLINTSGNMYIVVYRNSSNDDGYAKTFNISSNGIISDIIDYKAFEDDEKNSCFYPCIIHYNSENLFVIAYSNGMNKEGLIISISVTNNGSIKVDSDSRLQFYTRCYNPIIIQISEHVLAICFEGPGAHPGTLITLKYGQETYPPYKGITKLDSYGLYADITGVAVGSINNIMVNITDIPHIDTEWHHYSLTYDGNTIALSVHDINGFLIGYESKPYPNHIINETAADVYFGRFYSGFIDEVAIYDEALTDEIKLLDHIVNPGTFSWYVFN